MNKKVNQGFSKYLVFSKVAAFTGLAVGAFAMIGWLFDIAFFKSVDPHWLTIIIIVLLFIVLFYQVNYLNELDKKKLKDDLILKSILESTVNNSNLEQVRKRHREINLLNEFGFNMQACKTIEEAGRLIANYARRLFPLCSGSLFLSNPINTTLRMIATFNNPIFKEQIINSDDCWALRTGSLHNVVDREHDILCNHNTALAALSPPYMCVPLLVREEITGLFYLENGCTKIIGEDRKSQQILASTFSEQIALGLSNIELRETLREQSIRDVITGLYNRRYLEETLDRELLRMKREASPLSIIMIDIDYFKVFNDSYGHKAGDLLLHALGKLLVEKMRASDIVCRFGGEEFIIVMPKTPIDTAWQRAEKLRSEVSTFKISYGSDSQGPVSISLGVAAYPEHGIESKDIIAAADIALYQAKGKGRDTIVVYNQ